LPRRFLCRKCLPLLARFDDGNLSLKLLQADARAVDDRSCVPERLRTRRPGKGQR
jgi:hypothetical protein